MTPWQGWGPRNTYNRPGKRRFDEINTTIDYLRQEIAVNDMVLNSELEMRYYSDYERKLVAAELYKDRLLALTESSRSQISYLQTGAITYSSHTEYDRYGPKRKKYNCGDSYYTCSSPYTSPQNSRTGYSYYNNNSYNNNSYYNYSQVPSHKVNTRKRPAPTYVQETANNRRYTPTKKTVKSNNVESKANSPMATNTYGVKTFTATSTNNTTNATGVKTNSSTSNTGTVTRKPLHFITHPGYRRAKRPYFSNNTTKSAHLTTKSSNSTSKSDTTSNSGTTELNNNTQSAPKTAARSETVGKPIPIVVTIGSSLKPTVTEPRSTAVPIKQECNTATKEKPSLLSCKLSPIKLRFAETDRISIKSENIKKELNTNYECMIDDLENHI